MVHRSIRKNAVVICVAMLVISAISAAAVKAAMKREYVIGGHFESGAGISSSQLFEMSSSLMNLIVNEFGMSLKMKRFSTNDELMEDFLQGHVDAMGMYNEQAPEVLTRGLPIGYWGTYTLDGKRNQAYCLWRRKGEEIRTMDDLSGKVLIGNSLMTQNMLQLRELLTSDGKDRALRKTFKSFILAPSANSAFMAVAMKKADVCWESKDYLVFMKIMSPATLARMEPAFCTAQDIPRGTILFNMNRISKKDFGVFLKARDVFNGHLSEFAKKDPGIRQMQQFMRMTKLVFVDASTEDFAPTLKLRRNGEKRGWLNEAKFLADLIGKSTPGKTVIVEPTFAFCQKECSGKKRITECLDACMLK